MQGIEGRLSEAVSCCVSGPEKVHAPGKVHGRSGCNLIRCGRGARRACVRERGKRNNIYSNLFSMDDGTYRTGAGTGAGAGAGPGTVVYHSTVACGG